jgi:hypothetical protein
MHDPVKSSEIIAKAKQEYKARQNLDQFRTACQAADEILEHWNEFATYGMRAERIKNAFTVLCSYAPVLNVPELGDWVNSQPHRPKLHLIPRVQELTQNKVAEYFEELKAGRMDLLPEMIENIARIDVSRF